MRTLKLPESNIGSRILSEIYTLTDMYQLPELHKYIRSLYNIVHTELLYKVHMQLIYTTRSIAYYIDLNADRRSDNIRRFGLFAEMIASEMFYQVIRGNWSVCYSYIEKSKYSGDGQFGRESRRVKEVTTSIIKDASKVDMNAKQYMKYIRLLNRWYNINIDYDAGYIFDCLYGKSGCKHDHNFSAIVNVVKLFIDDKDRDAIEMLNKYLLPVTF